MWYTYEQRMYMDFNIHIHEFAGMSQFVMCLCACWIACDPTCPFQSQVRQAASAAGGTRDESWHESTSIIKSISLGCHLSHNNVIHTHVRDFKFFIFVPIPLPPFCIKWCQHSSRIKWCLSNLFVHTIFISSTPVCPNMALLPVQPILQALFAPILHTQRELARAHEIICQVDDLSDYTDDNHLQEASLHLAQVRQRLRAVITHLKLRLTIQMIQLARFFRAHFRQTNTIPIVNLDFRWVLNRSKFWYLFAYPRPERAAMAMQIMHPSREKDEFAAPDLSAQKHMAWRSHDRSK